MQVALYLSRPELVNNTDYNKAMQDSQPSAVTMVVWAVAVTRDPTANAWCFWAHNLFNSLVCQSWTSAQCFFMLLCGGMKAEEGMNFFQFSCSSKRVANYQWLPTRNRQREESERFSPVDDVL